MVASVYGAAAGKVFAVRVIQFPCSGVLEALAFTQFWVWVHVLRAACTDTGLHGRERHPVDVTPGEQGSLDRFADGASSFHGGKVGRIKCYAHVNSN